MPYTLDHGYTMFRPWDIVVVLGRPSADTGEFFNSLRFWTYDVRATSQDTALSLGDPNIRPGIEYAEKMAGGYEILNWYAFEKEEKKC